MVFSSFRFLRLLILNRTQICCERLHVVVVEELTSLLRITARRR